MTVNDIGAPEREPDREEWDWGTVVDQSGEPIEPGADAHLHNKDTQRSADEIDYDSEVSR